MIDPQKLVKFGIVSRFDANANQLTLLHSKPLDPYVVQDIAHSSNINIRTELVSSDEIEDTLSNIEKMPQMDSLISLEKQVSLSDIEAAARLAVNATSETDAPIVRLLDAVLTAAISRGASDLHFDIDENAFSIKLRIDGVLTPLTRFDVRLARMVIARLKILGNLDITERRRPQDGRIGLTYNAQPVDIRIACLPVQDDERIVLRFFRHLDGQKTISEIGLADQHIQAITKTVANQSGIILVCGPTGSGKTTTIYSLLNMLRGRGLNIMTIEDPVEVELSGIVQAQVNDNIGFDFASGLRSLLRHDPDVILVGEIRDNETANTAVRAALTGHLVIATIHANSPQGALMRLRNLDVDTGLLADALLGIFNQRLIRTYCEDCRSKSIASEKHLADLPIIFEGCDTCHFTGFSGRVPIMEHLLMSGEIKKSLANNLHGMPQETKLQTEAQQLFENGQTPFFEVSRVREIDV